MTEHLIRFLWLLLCMVPMLLVMLLARKANLKRTIRCKQFPMPVVGLAYSVVACLLGGPIQRWLQLLLKWLEKLVLRLADWLAQTNLFSGLGTGISNLVGRMEDALTEVGLNLLLFAVANAVILLVFLLLKRILITIFKSAFRDGGSLFEAAVRPFYEQEPDTGRRYLAEHCVQARQLLMIFYGAATVITVIAGMVICNMYWNGLADRCYYPVFFLIVIGEVYYFLGGIASRDRGSVSGEADDSAQKASYAQLRPALRTLFGDKLAAEGTTIDHPSTVVQTGDELLTRLEESDDPKLEAYGIFMRRRAAEGEKPEENYLLSGADLLNGKSILFNTQFYYDLIPYIFYPMNRVLLSHRKVLIVLGRHGMEADVKQWCLEGLTQVSKIPALWQVEVLSEQEQETDVGILTRSSVHDLKLHETNQAFFAKVGFVILIEPSKLMTTAQVGLHSIVQHCRTSGKEITYCSMDKNCDGLVDALSHILLSSLTEVSASRHHEGTSSYMCWETDDQRLQHRMLPNISRYLGLGTELSFAALKNQISSVSWFGGEAFPVVDIRWIAMQYYYSLMSYAGLPTTQEALNRCFQAEPNVWNARVRENACFSVEDEAFNMFEVRRNFSSRAKKQGFVNVLTSDYLLRDYMAENDRLFENDPKAIPYIVADYDRTRRNVALRLCLRLSTVPQPEESVRRELSLVGVDGEDTVAALWHEICLCHQPIGQTNRDADDGELLVTELPGGVLRLDQSVICRTRIFSAEEGCMKDCLCIQDPQFIRAVSDELANARYIAEDEDDDPSFLGSELQGHIYQNHLPGQFFTLNGKYYEMLRGTGNGDILVRRAADHIDGRPSYRQVREYRIFGLCDSDAMGESRRIGGMCLTWQYADLYVDTPSYWQMRRYHDFSTAKEVVVNGIPRRSYRNKRILRLDFAEETGITPEILRTTALLMNEVFRTLFAENQSYLAAVLPGWAEIPVTYSLFAEGTAELRPDSIYIIEDSQMDIGLLTAVERSLPRILSILCDYLDWHLDFLEESLNPSPPQPVPTIEIPKEDDPEAEGNTEKSGGIFGGRFRRRAGKKKDRSPEEGGSDSAVGEKSNLTDRSPVLRSTDGGSVLRDEVAQPDETGKGGVSFEADDAVKAGAAEGMIRKPYCERYYLLFGGDELPTGIVPRETLDFLCRLGYGDNELSQARNGKDIAQLVEAQFDPNVAGAHYCDFCGAQLMGTEYEVLRDGRERCMNCSRTVIKTEAEFVTMYQSVRRSLESYFGARIHVPVDVQMVNARHLHKALGKTFTPTGDMDARTLGVAIRKGKEYSLLIENGSPRMASMMTMIHELTHIWQYEHWDAEEIRKKYGPLELEVYEGMAKWTEIQYAYLLNETETAKREELITRTRDDAYGHGFLKYAAVYPLSEKTSLSGSTPFEHLSEPLPLEAVPQEEKGRRHTGK